MNVYSLLVNFFSRSPYSSTDSGAARSEFAKTHGYILTWQGTRHVSWDMRRTRGSVAQGRRTQFHNSRILKFLDPQASSLEGDCFACEFYNCVSVVGPFRKQCQTMPRSWINNQRKTGSLLNWPHNETRQSGGRCYNNKQLYQSQRCTDEDSGAWAVRLALKTIKGETYQDRFPNEVAGARWEE